MVVGGLRVPGLMNAEMETAPTNSPPAPTKPGQGSLGIDGSPGKVLLVEVIGS